MSQFNEIEVFGGKNLADIFQEIYENHEAKKNQIKELVAQLTPLIQGIGDATLLIPLIKEYMELGIKNDDQLVKLAQIIQRIDSGKKTGSSEFDFDSLQNLLVEDQSIGKEIEKVGEESKIAVDGTAPQVIS